MAEYIVQTHALKKMSLRNMLGLETSDIDKKLTLNWKYDILKDLNISNFHPIGYFGLGINGEVNDIVRKPNQNNLTLYNLIPIHINDVTDQFNPTLNELENDKLREKYRLRIALNKNKIRVPLDSNEITHYAYFLKKIDPQILQSQKIVELSEETFVYTDENLKKYLRGEIGTTYTVPNGKEFTKLPYYQDQEKRNTIARSKIILSLNNEGDIISTIKYFNDDSFGKISEIGLFTGSDRNIEISGKTFKEVSGCQLALHNTFNSINMSQEQFNINIDMVG